MRIGWVRATKTYSVSHQIDRLADAGVEDGRVEQEWRNLDMALREGDVMVVLHPGVIAQDEADYRVRMQAVANRGATVHSLADDKEWYPMDFSRLDAAKKFWASDRAKADKAEMRRRGLKGGAPKKLPEGSPAYKLAVSLLKMDKNHAEIIGALWQSHQVSVSRSTLVKLAVEVRKKGRGK